MTPAKNLALRCLLCLSVFCFILAGPAIAQSGRAAEPAPPTQIDDGMTVRALLNEVRLLRLSFQRWNLNSHRAQIVVERVRAQQEHVDRLKKDLAELQKQIAELKLEQKRMEAYLKELEEQILREQVALRRNEMATQLRRMKLELELQGQREEMLRDREVKLGGQLQTEEARLRELNDHLDALEKDLEAQQPSEKPQPEKPQPAVKQH